MAGIDTPKAPITGTAILYTIISLVGIGAASIVGVAIGGPEDSTPLISSIMALIVPTIGVLVLLIKVEQVHRVVNSAAAELKQANEQILAMRDLKITAQAETISAQQQKLKDQRTDGK